jgi:hypothetical protein
MKACMLGPRLVEGSVCHTRSSGLRAMEGHTTPVSPEVMPAEACRDDSFIVSTAKKDENARETSGIGAQNKNMPAPPTGILPGRRPPLHLVHHGPGGGCHSAGLAVTGAVVPSEDVNETYLAERSASSPASLPFSISLS